jgi:DNA-binding NarL/FixJ family response regulator
MARRTRDAALRSAMCCRELAVTVYVACKVSPTRSAGLIVATNKLGQDERFSVADVRLKETFAARCAVAVRLAAHGGSDREPEEADVERVGLTTRETEVLRLVAHGRSDAQIADKLVVSERTVHSHLRSIYRKLQAGSRSEATRWAVERRLA